MGCARGQDFYQIAKGLPYRSTGECVEFFYANKKSDIFISIRRKHQLKKRRLQSESNREACGLRMWSTMKSDTSIRHMSEMQRTAELQSWVLTRLDDSAEHFTDTELKEAVEKFGCDRSNRSGQSTMMEAMCDVGLIIRH